ncbi:amino acid adenylation domain-containing protein [Streptomyces nogalater]|uniref:Amino acid adenylation domain-containing protein n=1 Tax=Streptomyces nogalater TaxID=38314 RepID=A0ABW0WCT1_STRNO
MLSRRVRPQADGIPALAGDSGPLSWAQQGIWLTQQMAPDSAAFHLSLHSRLTGPLAPERLSDAFAQVLARHSALRTRFPVDADGTPRQQVDDRASAHLETTDLSGHPGPEREALTERLARTVSDTPFDLATGPLIRAHLVRLAPEEHILLLTVHHIVCDGGSAGILLRSLLDAYGGAGAPAVSASRHLDYAAWHRGRHDATAAAEPGSPAGYWQSRLDGHSGLLELPPDRPRPARFGFRGARLRLRLPEDLVARLRRLGTERGATLFMVLLAGVYATIARCSGQSDIVIGTPVENRDHPELRDQVGLFVNTLPLRLDLSDAPAFDRLLDRVKDLTLEALRHRDVPFEHIVRRLSLPRDPSVSPLFQLAFTYQEAPDFTLAAHGLSLEPVDFGTRTTKNDVTFCLIGAERGLDGYLEYNTEVFDAERMNDLVAHFTTLLRAAADAPERPVGDLTVLTDEQRARVLRYGTGSAPAATGLLPAHELFEECARRHPERTAVTALDGELTYRELDTAAERLAARLTAHGVGPESTVALVLGESTRDLVVAVLGVLKAGGAYVPVDVTQPAARTARIIDTAGARVALTNAAFADRVPEPNGLEVVRVDAGDPDGTPAHRPPVAVTARNTAYVLFTSGSTGLPKGVAVEHGNLSAYLAAVTEETRPAPGDSHVMVQSLSVDSSVTALWPPLITGGRVHLVPREDAADPARMRELFARYAFDHLKITPSHFAALQGVVPRKSLVVGGENADAAPLEAVKREHPACVVINEYGPTETTVGVVSQVVREGTRSPWAALPIGRPMPGVRVHVLDDRLQPVPPGAVGEICVGGAFVARGYIGRPEATAEAFVPDPFSGVPGARLYRTGDLGRFLADGTLQCLGRADFQIKVRGFRVEPAEVEAALCERDDVVAAVADARTVGAGTDKVLVAYVQPRAGTALDAEALRRHVAERLPAQMVPTAFVEIAGVPRTSNGKVRREELRDPEPADFARSGAGAAGGAGTTDQIEDLMAAVWTELLGIEPVPRQADFFALGGHSLLATRMLSRIKALFGVDIALREVFDAPTLTGVAARVRAALTDPGAARTAALPIERQTLSGDLPLSPAQLRLWFLTAYDPGLPLYNVPIALRVEGVLDPRALGRALTRMTDRHTVLRSVFPQVAGVPVQRVTPVSDIAVDVRDFTGADTGAARAAASAWLRRRMDLPFDLATGPLLRAHMARIADDEALLLISLHHIVFDRWSQENFLAEISEFYRAERAGRTAELPGLPVQYADFAVWQRAALTTGAMRAQLAYWRERLRDLPPPLELHGQRPRPERRAHKGDFVAFTVDGATREQVVRLARAEGCTPFMVLMAGYQLALHRAGGGEDLLVGIPIAGRLRPEVEPLIGFFVNTLPIRADLSGAPGFREVLSRVRRTALDAYAHQEIPFDHLVGELRPPRARNRDPFFDVLFAFQNVPRGEGLDLDGVRLTPLPFDEWIAKRDLTLRIEDQRGEYHGVLEYDTELFERATVEAFARDFAAVIAAAVADPEAQLTHPRPAGPGANRTTTRRPGMTADPKAKTGGRAAFARMKEIRPEKVRVDGAPPVRQEFLPGRDGTLPAVVRALAPDTDLAAWSTGNGELIQRLLDKHGAVLLRGFSVPDAAAFRRFAATRISELMDYQERSTPRHQVDENNVYTSTEYPNDQYIEQHNEMAYAHVWPSRIAFFAKVAATEGGATPVADSRAVYRALPERIRAPFEEKGVMYVRNYGAGIDLPWQEVFQTSDRQEAERYCRASGIEFTWLDGDGLHTRQVGPAALDHPTTGERVWFNSAHMFHVAAFEPAARTSLRTLFTEERLPRHAYYGDGTPIPDEVIEEIRAVYRELAVSFPWRRGDVMLLDNMLACHGREPYQGDREVLVAFGDPQHAAG